jgi:hypothetical protein
VLTVFATLLALFATQLPAAADPGTDSEGQTQALSAKLEAAAKSYYDIKAKLTASQRRQADIKKKLDDAQLSLLRLTTVVSNIAAARYKGGQIGILDGLLTGQGDPKDLLQAGAVAEYLIWRDDDQLRQYRQAQDDAKRNQDLLTAEIANEKKQYSDLDRAKRSAEKALAGVGGLISAGFVGNAGGDAQPAPRNADGSFPNESCTVNDPTSGGCIKPRLYHALTEARLAGFTRYTHCWREQSWGEHPKGQACDFSAEKSGFGGVATGGNRTYGNKLAAWFIKNSEALGVMYVIWFRQIWMPGIGWRSYDGCCDAAATHENHVHLSVL